MFWVCGIPCPQFPELPSRVCSLLRLACLLQGESCTSDPTPRPSGARQSREWEGQGAGWELGLSSLCPAAFLEQSPEENLNSHLSPSGCGEGVFVKAGE